MADLNSFSDNPKKVTQELTKKFFDNYYNREINYNASEVDAVIGYFLKRGFDKIAAVNTASVLLQQADIDQITVFKLIDTLKGVNDVQLSNIVAQILNINRSKVSTLGYRVPEKTQLFEQRQIIV
jgi:succinate dehydrogenase flavin-adding protein (antitoxin of CptAB toxin-antitoxin module)